MENCKPRGKRCFPNPLGPDLEKSSSSRARGMRKEGGVKNTHLREKGDIKSEKKRGGEKRPRTLP